MDLFLLPADKAPDCFKCQGDYSYYVVSSAISFLSTALLDSFQFSLRATRRDVPCVRRVAGGGMDFPGAVRNSSGPRGARKARLYGTFKRSNFRWGGLTDGLDTSNM